MWRKLNYKQVFLKFLSEVTTDKIPKYGIYSIFWHRVHLNVLPQDCTYLGSLTYYNVQLEWQQTAISHFKNVSTHISELV